MNDGGDLYAPIRREAGGAVEVMLGENHPGFADTAYRARRNEIAGLAIDWEPGDPVPQVDYTETEHEVWRTVHAELRKAHEAHAAKAFLEGKENLALPPDHVPQLTEVTERLEPLTGFRYFPVAGLAPLREFYGSFAESIFFSTQYIRHHSMPLYTPEPDLIHEVMGHANQLAVPEFADIYRLVGQAVGRITTEPALKFLSQVFWFTMEFGVVWEGGEPRAYGAGILSSFGEMEEYAKAEIRPFDFHQMGILTYDITRYQPVLFGAESMGQIVEEVSAFFAGFDDETHARMTETLKAG